jgi:hypothetical protein
MIEHGMPNMLIVLSRVKYESGTGLKKGAGGDGAGGKNSTAYITDPATAALVACLRLSVLAECSNSIRDGLACIDRPGTRVNRVPWRTVRGSCRTYEGDRSGWQRAGGKENVTGTFWRIRHHHQPPAAFERNRIRLHQCCLRSPLLT